mmetsp:Transcript_5248/g.11695  ORF Transcript_5248/g.11695 Transcript_5248/m.11695 type:complete len:228 (-) Transcript_5248:118-801(-)|eukprot:CAMPEP_0178374124 /NCGR_PEP_ID=MMETSP0689_2-20121128/2216_1 /TAXON_ID=160604 /ORGANISM="Amphidinium massartii, Strain CS-259" /LENGTH=227 /DNA_ID=CAMNT_0019994087 /DNA_START=21 /DNA_END=704 /DNA_ORIENTATION=+
MGACESECTYCYDAERSGRDNANVTTPFSLLDQPTAASVATREDLLSIKGRAADLGDSLVSASKPQKPRQFIYDIAEGVGGEPVFPSDDAGSPPTPAMPIPKLGAWRGPCDFTDGSTYKGEFQDGRMHGVGTYSWRDGRTYFGHWRKGLMHGHGQFCWPDGRKFQGRYVNGAKEGTGIFKWADGSKYCGRWKAGLQHGRGLYTSDTGELVDGVWQDGLLQENGKAPS